MSANVGVVVLHERPLAANLAADLIRWLEAHGDDVRVPASDADAAEGIPARAVPDDEFARGLDLAVSVGGDGTMLRTFGLVSRCGVPILGINMGHLGYLTAVEPAQWQEAVTRVLAGDYGIEERMTIDVRRVVHGEAAEPRTALNDVVVEKQAAGHTVRVAVTLSGQRAISYAADGLIVSTPTGSTAYNLSAGGPVLSPHIQALVVTPVAAHSLFGRSLVVGPDEVVRVEVETGAAVLGVDGVHLGVLGSGDVIECRVSEHPARFVTFDERDFWRVITAKFGLDPR
jgi:NAD+ kinase